MANGSQKKRRVPLIATLAVKKEFISQEQLDQMLAQCSGKVSEKEMAQQFLLSGLISKKNVHRLSTAVKVLSIHRQEHRFGAIALAKGFVNKSVLDLALEDQKKSIRKGEKTRRIGNVMVEAGLLTVKQRDSILKLQKQTAMAQVGEKPKSQPIPRQTVSKKALSPQAAPSFLAPDKTSKKQSTALFSDAPQSQGSDPAAQVADSPDTKKKNVSPAMDASSGPSDADQAPDSSLKSDASMESQVSPESDTPLGPDAPDVPLEPAIKIVGGMLLKVAEDHLSAYLTKDLAVDPGILAVMVRTALAQEQIVYGLADDDEIEAFIRAPILESTFFKVAQGIDPDPGKEARTEYFFSTEYLKAGGMDENGNIDFKVRGETPLVEKGTVLAEEITGTPAEPGMDIHGNTVPARNHTGRPLSFGTGATLSEDGQKVLATVRGYPKLTLSGVITVHEEFTTKADVGYETGHVNFDGNIRVKGCIKAGFKVKGAAVTAVELDGGEVIADGDLTIAHGINGAKVYARGNVYAEFINDSRIVCMGDVFVKKEIVDAEIECSGACSVINGRLISSKVSAKMGVMARSIGTPTALASTLTVGHDAFLVQELEKNRLETQNVQKIIQTHQKLMETIKQQMDKLQAQITHLAHTQDQAQQELQKIQARLPEITNKQEEQKLRAQSDTLAKRAAAAEKKIQVCFDQSEDMEEQMGTADLDIAQLEIEESCLKQEHDNLISWSHQNPGKPRVVVNADMEPGTVIIGQYSQITIDTRIRHARVTELPVKPSHKDDPVIYQMQIGNF